MNTNGPNQTCLHGLFCGACLADDDDDVDADCDGDGFGGDDERHWHFFVQLVNNFATAQYLLNYILNRNT